MKAKQAQEENAEDKQQRIQKGLTQLGLEGAKGAQGDSQEEIMNKRRALYANIKQGLAEEN